MAFVSKMISDVYKISRQYASKIKPKLVVVVVAV